MLITLLHTDECSGRVAWRRAVVDREPFGRFRGSQFMTHMLSMVNYNYCCVNAGRKAPRQVIGIKRGA